MRSAGPQHTHPFARIKPPDEKTPPSPETVPPAAPPYAPDDAPIPSVAAAYAYCRRLARRHYENFTVGSLLLPRQLLPHAYALYAYCRTVDDLGDAAVPPHPYTPDELAAYRLSCLDWWQSELESCYHGQPAHPVMVALQQTIRAFDLPPQPFLKLIAANRFDQQTRRYPTYADLLHYCDHSANPVGHLALHLFGYHDPELQALSDATCTALQLTNFWQDVARDYQMGRIYLPQADLDAFGYTESDLAAGVVNAAFRQLLAFQVARTKDLFRQGAALPPLLDGRVQLDVALFTKGGLAVLDAIQKRNYDVLTARPALSRRRKASLFLSTWLNWKLGRGFPLPPPAAGAGR